MDFQNLSLIFIHIPKTAGSTLGHPLHRQYHRESTFLIDGNFPERSVEEFLTLPIEERGRYHCISGHIPFGLHEYLPGKVVYLSVLRDPIERLISLYYHILQEKTHYLYEAVAEEEMSLLEFTGSRLSTELHNDQTRRISGRGQWDQKTDKTPVDEEVYQQALDNIEAHFPVVGLTERFDESLLLIQDAYSWETIFYTRRKVAHSRPERGEIDPQVVEVIKEQNQYDLQLYAYAQQRLERQIEEKGKGFQVRLRRFRRTNHLYNSFRALKETLPLSGLWNLARKGYLAQVDRHA